MKNWIKKEIQKETVIDISKKYALDSLTASILTRRGITSGKDILYYLEDDLRFLHNPFLFNQMEDAVDRILDAKDEGEKVLIFGDSDVDGITSTTILYEYLKSIGLDVQFKVPEGDEAYGMNNETIDEFAANYGTLIITVDCGISNHKEIQHAAELGIDVIVTDHHNVPEVLPEAAVIINPKLPDSNYPFKEISGCAVAFKLVQALRFASTELYKMDVCLLHASENENSWSIECLKLHNNVEKDRLLINNITEPIRISDTKLESFLKGQQIFVWDDKSTKRILREIFGTAVEFNTFDLRPEVAQIIPGMSNCSLEELKSRSKIAHYEENELSLIDSFKNIFITFINQKSNRAFPQKQALENDELQLVCLAALADVMPLQNENRIFVKHGLKIINAGKPRRGLCELLSKLNLLNKKISATDLAWTLIPAINATGRLGQPELAISILLEEEPVKRDSIANQIINLNIQRKELVNNAQQLTLYNADQSVQALRNFCLTIDDRIHQGVIGLISARYTQKYHVPSITVTFTEDNLAVGSMRSCRGLDCTEFLSKFKELFINYGGHNKAAGFSITKENLEILKKKIESTSSSLNLLDSDEDDIIIDAEIPPTYISPDILKTIDIFEPYGETNKTLNFMTRGIKLISYQIVGKTEKQHLKLILDNGRNKIPVMYWNAADKIGKDFNVGNNLNIVYNVERNVFNGMESMQLVALDIQM
ncbi:MAG: single-stranded-DNA-specific exonuclease RecJ [Treponema sp.]|uniref:single-stranded-DNA-specific exonuclease RecJ n=1 Tax=Treponema sp. TaxID=166 RepID=UPI001B758E7A|nr:single-stranded-DNA-specific exonuclease RecJ [Treponema sp.]MBP5402455.1 single-stranded-DNA-specific exonuclease RecJ [Treponema sp.]MBR5933278.1 single-stranded-DNA-specific exonuclease RecJ [Treponema sp.]